MLYTETNIMLYINQISIKKKRKRHLKAMVFKVWVLQSPWGNPPLQSWVGVKSLHVYKSPG